MAQMSKDETGDSPRRRHVVWLNGAFGVGKTTVADGLRSRWPNAALFDPEGLARLLRGALPAGERPSDYQDLALWRRLTVEAICGICEQSRLTIVPMTMVNKEHFREVVGGLQHAGVTVSHFSLVARPTTIRRRLLKRQLTRPIHPKSTLWALRRVESASTALCAATFAEVVDTDGMAAAEVVSRIAGSVETARRGSANRCRPG